MWSEAAGLVKVMLLEAYDTSCVDFRIMKMWAT